MGVTGPHETNPAETNPEEIGPYTIERELGRGGGGVVYLATDRNLDRRVAIKCLPAETAADPERMARLEREAKALAALNHPHVAGIYGLERVGDACYLILEYVEGEPLGDTLERGPLSIPDALECARQIADGVEAAHERGIIHRDLKPDNTIRGGDATVKILDFGLAKELNRDATAKDSSLDLTDESVIVGTPRYLSPEQARGRAVDKRTDIWGFGCVLFECLTGHPAFRAESVAELLQRILEAEPDYGALPRRTPASVVRLLERCLEKDPRQRLRDIGDARLELEHVIANREWTGSIPRRTHRDRGAGSRLRLALAAAALVIASVWLTIAFRGDPVRTESSARTLELSVDVRGGGSLLVAGAPTEREFAYRISPDGARIAFIGVDQDGDGTVGLDRLYLRDLDDPRARPVPGSEGLHSFTFSPDGAYLAMVVPQSPESSRVHLVRVAAQNAGPPEVLAATWKRQPIAWLESGEIISSTARDSMLQVRVGGGLAETVKIDNVGFEPAYEFQPLRSIPGTRSALIEIQHYVENRFTVSLGVLDTDRKLARILVENASSGVCAPGGHLLFARRDRLMVVPFEQRTADVLGDARVVREGMGTVNSWRHAWFDMSRDGTLLYLPGGVRGARRQLVIISSTGEIKPWSDSVAAFEDSLYVSDDGRRFTVSRASPVGLYQVWGADFTSDQIRLLASEPRADCYSSVLSHEGEFVVYQRFGSSGQNGIYRVPFVGPRQSTLLFELPRGELGVRPLDLSPADDALLFSRRSESEFSLWLLDLREKEQPPVLVASGVDDGYAGFSPDGRWITYISRASGRVEVHLRRCADDYTTVGPEMNVALPPGHPPTSVYWGRKLRNSHAELILYYSSKNRIEGMELVGEDPIQFSNRRVIHDLSPTRLPFASDLMPDGSLFAIRPGPEEADVGHLNLIQGFLRELAK